MQPTCNVHGGTALIKVHINLEDKILSHNPYIDFLCT